MATPEQQKQLQALSDEYTALQTDLQTTVAARQKLESQQQENKGVKSEFANLDDDANIYKLVGPILLKQDASEAKSTVDGRLEFIDKEINRIEKQISDIQAKSEEKKMAVFQLQTDIQQSGQAPA
ncbi:prefoldin subunit 6 [Aureobasidium namibiae CBS 147.97]|uniref:Prefoldin subunit 6 n=1 Tax=Aureobasidium namibiae CBS 147.97 TaxID=1043004 RepID=A0A074WH78_9PEZI